MPWTSRGIVQGESDLCQVVTLVTSHQGTGTPAGDPQFLKIRANQVAPSLFIHNGRVFWTQQYHPVLIYRVFIIIYKLILVQ